MVSGAILDSSLSTSHKRDRSRGKMETLVYCNQNRQARTLTQNLILGIKSFKRYDQGYEKL
ncbi:hypothetical protein [Cylindrospermopsis raciborskii]|uniref:Uncharacterized protein n=1 Tax=Cylindrospermopsis raciborskii CENA302 TaxID=1170768 RepID=A0A9Q5QY54_9CYAN|nr:hypothetical protein [Cylindrospermopsis raciborskii]NLQ05321.1 hypothetical protein [Cylindrospermopsis raciborskii MVCC19]OPH10561.1 hypothetical protein CENA302_04870 [Cylindrospermopsis raciborskii CENA302]